MSVNVGDWATGALDSGVVVKGFVLEHGRHYTKVYVTESEKPEYVGQKLWAEKLKVSDRFVDPEFMVDFALIIGDENEFKKWSKRVNEKRRLLGQSGIA